MWSLPNLHEEEEMGTKRASARSSRSRTVQRRQPIIASAEGIAPNRIKGKGIENKEIWTNENIGKLIENVHKYPSIWDSSHPDFMSWSKKRDAFVELTKIFPVSKNDIRKKFDNLKIVYQRNRYASQSRSKHDQAPTKKWLFYDAMDNLLGPTYDQGVEFDWVDCTVVNECAEDESQSDTTSSSSTRKRKRIDAEEETPLHRVERSSSGNSHLDSEELGCAFLATLLRTSKRSESDKLKFIFHMQKCFYEFEKGSLNVE